MVFQCILKVSYGKKKVNEIVKTRENSTIGERERVMMIFFYCSKF